MKRSIFFKPKLPHLLVLTVWVVIAEPVKSQSVIRQSISPFGSSSGAGSLHVSATVGQPYHTSGSVSEDMTLRPGFQQAPRIRLEESDLQSKPSLSLQFYPNPAQDRIILESQEELTKVKIIVLDQLGSTIHSQNLASMKSHRIDCQTWMPGSYLLSVAEQNGKKQTIKIIITH